MALRRVLRELLAPAPDPRQACRAGAEHDPERLLGSIRDAYESVAAARAHLEARAAELRERRPESLELELLERQLRAADVQAERLAEVNERLTARLEAFGAREQMLALRQSAARAHVLITEVLAGITDEPDVAPDLTRAEVEAETMEARADAIEQMLDTGMHEGRPR
jgi:phage shock protein A